MVYILCKPSMQKTIIIQFEKTYFEQQTTK